MIIKGQKINDRYEIIRSIGEGGMANVYLAEDTILNRKVAVKILRGDLANDEKFVRRFQREAISASSLSHPNIVEMYDVGEDDGKYFIVMEYVEGKSLKSLIKKRGGLTLPETLDIMLQLTDGIACAHNSYIIHRDIKPQNIIILDDGRVKITDFGIAQALNRHELTETNSVMGSVHYLPPEQANGTGTTIKSDIYSLGIVMFELLTGKVPFKGENAVEIAIKQMKDPMPSVREYKENIPQSIENIILKATAKNPKNRYDSVLEMQEDIKTALREDRRDEPKIQFKYPEFEKQEEKETLTRSEKNRAKETEIEEMEKEKKSNKVLWVSATIIALVVIIGALLIMFLPGLKKVPDIQVPDVKNMELQDAIRELEKLGFEVETEEQFHEEIKEGNVIKTNPTIGRTVKKGTVITVTVSKGLEGFLAENYVGKQYDIVEAALTAKGLKVKKETKEFTEEDEKKENEIVEQSIKEGEELKAGDTITLTTVKIIVTYPDFVNENYTLDQVKKFCEENNLVLTANPKTSTEYDNNTIIYQSRQAGSKVVSGAKLTVTYAVKKEKVKDDTTNDQTTTDDKTTQEEQKN